MRFTTGRPRRVPEVFADDPRPGASGYVYCKGCGTPLETRDRFSRPKPMVSIMMCDPCRERHGHDLIPTPGSTTYCYRCGGRDEIFVSRGTWPETHHVCPRCLPDRAARFRSGNFAPREPEASPPGVGAVGPTARTSDHAT